jgi:hypothetical protein
MMVTVTETRSELYIIEYIALFWLNDILVSTTTQRSGSYKKTVIFHVNFSLLLINVIE